MAGDERFLRRTADLDLDSGIVAADERTAAVEERDLVLLEQVQDAVVVLLDHAVLAGKHLRQVETQALDLDTVGSKVVAGLLVVFRRLQQRLGRNAADIRAGPARR